MRRSLQLWCAAVVLTSLLGLYAADSARLERIRAVYFWPMSSSLDQYLAEQIAAEGLFEVVVDPNLATAVMTERIDAPFLEAMDELFPLPASEESTKKPAEAEEAEQDSLEGDFRLRRPANRVVSRPRGTLFLVDVRSRRVLWSTFLKEYDSTPNNLHKQARRVVGKLKKQLGEP